MKTIFAAAMMTAVLAGSAMAQAPVTGTVKVPDGPKSERYEQLALAEAYDEKCGFLPYIEHQALSNVAWTWLEISSFYGATQKMSDRDALPKFYEKQTAAAAALACDGPTAQKVLIPFRYDTVLELAVAAATVEVRTQSNSITDPFNTTSPITPPTADETKSALLLKAFVLKLWGTNAEAGWKRALEIAEQRRRDKPNASEWSQLLYMVDYQGRAERDKALLVAGPRPWERLRSAAGKMAFTQRRATFGSFGSAFVYLTVRDGQVLASGHKMGVNDFPGLTGLRLFVRKPATPTTKNSLPITWDATWRTQAQGFDMVATTETLYGGTVYKASPAALTALKALNEEDEVEVAVVRGDDDQAAKGGSSRTTFKVKGLKAILAQP
jgi:hypothetical protein